MPLKILSLFCSLYSMYTLPYFSMLFVYIINLPKPSGVNHSPSSNFTNFVLFWLIMVQALCFTALHSLQYSRLLSLPHLKHCMLTFGYRVNFRKVYRLCLSLSACAPWSKGGWLFAYCLYFRSLPRYYSIVANLG